MLCQNCQKENPEGTKYCGHCGSELVASQVTPPPPPIPQIPEQPTSVPVQNCGLATASLVFGLLGFCTVGLSGIVGLILGIRANRKIRDSHGQLGGSGMATAGIIVSAIMLAGILPMAAIFGAILFPICMASQEKAKQTTCANNLKQLSSALMAYNTDWSGRYPPKDAWCDVTIPYIEKYQKVFPATYSVYSCPSLLSSRSGYAYNKAMNKISVADIDRPSYSVMLFDSSGGWNQSGGFDLFDYRHNDKANVAYADGHIKPVSPEELKLESSSPEGNSSY
jgi:prepilin-type processing-associated H-X9-DG protein